MLYTYKTKLYTYTQNIYICVKCHNMRNLYHIHVIDKKYTIYIYINMCIYSHYYYFYFSS